MSLKELKIEFDGSFDVRFGSCLRELGFVTSTKDTSDNLTAEQGLVFGIITNGFEPFLRRMMDIAVAGLSFPFGVVGNRFVMGVARKASVDCKEQPAEAVVENVV